MFRGTSAFLFSTLALSAALFFSGCQKKTDDANNKTGDDPPAGVAGNGNGNGFLTSGPWKGDVKVVVGGWKELKEIIDANKGKVVVVDFWSTWCEPCMAEMPHLVHLQKTFGGKVACVTVNLNYDGSPDSKPEKTRDEIVETMKRLFGKALAPDEKLDQAIPVFIANVADEPFYREIGQKLFDDEEAVTAVPTILVIGKDGKPTKFDINGLPKGDKEVTYKKHITPFVEKLLK